MTEEDNGTERVTVRFSRDSSDLLDFLDRQVEEAKQQGVHSDRSEQIRIAIRHRQLALLPERTREQVLESMRAAEARGKTKAAEKEQGDLFQG